MQYKKSFYFLLTFFILGLLYTKIDLHIDYQTRSFIGYFLLAAYLIGSTFLLSKPISSNPKLKKHFFIRLTILLVVIFLGVLPFISLQQHDSLGSGYFLYFASAGLGILFGTYMAIETIVLARRKKYDHVIINFTLAEAVYCLLIFSNLFGF